MDELSMRDTVELAAEGYTDLNGNALNAGTQGKYLGEGAATGTILFQVPGGAITVHRDDVTFVRHAD